MNVLKNTFRTTAAAVVLLGMTQFALADTISPTSYTDTLAVGESVTIRKTVVVEASGPTDALIDIHFLIDTSGSMGGAIDGAKAAASDILTGLAVYGDDLASGVGVFSEGAYLPGTPPGSVINSDLTTTAATTIAAINAVTLGNPDGGGDFPERGQDAVKLAVDNLSWRPGSTRFVVALGDASWKNDITTDAAAIAALDAADAELIGLRFGNYSYADSDSDDTTFTESVEDLGGTVYSPGTDPDDIVTAIIAGVDASFASYGEVTVSDLGVALPGVAVSAECVGADIGACVGEDAVGAYDRSIDRTFEFDVTFEKLMEGDYSFDTLALVDGARVATEADVINGSEPVPEPSTVLLFGSGLLGLALLRRRRG